MIIMLNTMNILILKNPKFKVYDNVRISKYNNTVHRTIKMKPIEVTDDYYAEYNEYFNFKKS